LLKFSKPKFQIVANTQNLSVSLNCLSKLVAQTLYQLASVLSSIAYIRSHLA